MNPIPADAGGDLHWHPLNMGRLDQAGTQQDTASGAADA
jgi:hypothetical protein